MELLLSHWNGRFGNRMHQYAFGNTYAKINDFDFILPSDWEGSFLFKHKPKILLNDSLRANINQTMPPFNTEQWRHDCIVKEYPNSIRVNPEHEICYWKHNDFAYFDCMCAYRQFVFDKMSVKHLKEIFEFSDEVKALDIYKRLEDNQGKYTIAHLRRDDICNLAVTATGDVGYSTISLDSYKRAFSEYGVNYDNVKWVTDDNTLGIVNKKQDIKLGWSYPVGAYNDDKIGFDFLEDFLTMYFAKTVFRANSSFSWWACFLSSAEIFSPILKDRVVYGFPDKIEIEVDFERGNEQHWMHYCDKIVIPA